MICDSPEDEDQTLLCDGTALAITCQAGACFVLQEASKELAPVKLSSLP